MGPRTAVRKVQNPTLRHTTALKRGKPSKIVEPGMGIVAGRGHRRRPGRQSERVQDPGDGVGSMDGRDNLHPSQTTRALQNVQFPHPSQEFSPRIVPTVPHTRRGRQATVAEEFIDERDGIRHRETILRDDAHGLLHERRFAGRRRQCLNTSLNGLWEQALTRKVFPTIAPAQTRHGSCHHASDA
jgi:hypothetical protein